MLTKFEVTEIIFCPYCNRVILPGLNDDAKNLSTSKFDFEKTEEIINGKIFFKDIFRFSFMLILNWYSLNEKIDKNIKVVFDLLWAVN